MTRSRHLLPDSDCYLLDLPCRALAALDLYAAPHEKCIDYSPRRSVQTSIRHHAACQYQLGSNLSLSESMAILLEASPKKLDLDALQRALKEIPDVEAVHDLHAWTVSSGRLAMSVHLVSRDSDAALSAAHEILKKHFKIFHQTIQVEHPDKFESKYCFTHAYEEQKP